VIIVKAALSIIVMRYSVAVRGFHHAGKSVFHFLYSFAFHTNPDERPSNGLSEAMMKIKRTQGFHPRRVKFDFHTNPE